MPKVRRRTWSGSKPELVGEVEFVEWTHDGRLRAPSFQGLRDDKAAREVHAEEPLPAEIGKGKRRAQALQPRQGLLARGGDHEGRPARVLPARSRRRSLPHIRGPPVHDEALPRRDRGQALLPEGRARSTCRSGSRRGQFEVSTREQPRQKRTINVPLVNDELALLWMVNMGCIDLNTWYSRVDKPDRPDFVLFDLDPAADAGFPEVIQVALLVKEVLDALGLVGFPKTSGSDGMHVLVPIERRHTYDDTREFAAIVAGTLARTHRGLVTTEWTKAKRRGVLIDSNQNGEGKTIASVYSVRPHPGAPVSTPLRWDEVKAGLDPRSFTLDDDTRSHRARGRPVRGRVDDAAVARESTARDPLDGDGVAAGALARQDPLERRDAAGIEGGTALLPRRAIACSCVHAVR